MTNNNDLIDLYSKRILALAADIEHTKRLDNPQSTVKKRSPMCGSMVTVDICLNENKIDMLTKNGTSPNKPFEELEVLQPAKDFKNRHSSILLTFDAIADAINEIKKPDSIKTS